MHSVIIIWMEKSKNTCGIYMISIDIHKMLSLVKSDDSLRQLAASVYEERNSHVNCRSAKDGIDMNALLQETVNRAVYK